jgi:hypothetical protein
MGKGKKQHRKEQRNAWDESIRNKSEREHNKITVVKAKTGKTAQ